jgi:hypothetical protein
MAEEVFAEHNLRKPSLVLHLRETLVHDAMIPTQSGA